MLISPAAPLPTHPTPAPARSGATAAAERSGAARPLEAGAAPPTRGQASDPLPSPPPSRATGASARRQRRRRAPETSQSRRQRRPLSGPPHPLTQGFIPSLPSPPNATHTHTRARARAHARIELHRPARGGSCGIDRDENDSERLGRTRLGKTRNRRERRGSLSFSVHPSPSFSALFCLCPLLTGQDGQPRAQTGTNHARARAQAHKRTNARRTRRACGSAPTPPPRAKRAKRRR